MMHFVDIHDISVTDEFGRDFSNAPRQVQRKVNDLLEMTLSATRFPPSMNVHPTFSGDLYIGYVTRNKEHWRLLMWYDEETQTAIFHRLMTHDKMDRYLKNVPV